MRRNLLAALALVALGPALASTLAWSRPKSSPGCPRRAPKEDSPCKLKNAECNWQCEGEGHKDLSCSCTKDEHGAWRWQCFSTGIICVL